MLIKVHIFLLINIFIIGIGKIMVISTSKMRKITAIRKKCIENGRRASLFGSNPHSNVEIFFFIVFFYH